MELDFKYADRGETAFGIDYYLHAQSDDEEARMPQHSVSQNKKVTFKDELDFKQAQPLLLSHAKPQSKPKVPPKRSGSGSRSFRRETSGQGRPHVPKRKAANKTQTPNRSKPKSKLSTKARPRKIPEAKQEWCNGVAVGKFFDPSLAKTRPTTATAPKEGRRTASNQVEVNTEGSKTVGKFQFVGRTRTVEMYRDPNVLLAEQRPNKRPFLCKGEGLKSPPPPAKENRPKNLPPTSPAQPQFYPQPQLPQIDPPEDREKVRMRIEFEKNKAMVATLQQELEHSKAREAQLEAQRRADLVKAARAKTELDLVPTREKPAPPQPTASAKKDPPRGLAQVKIVPSVPLPIKSQPKPKLNPNQNPNSRQKPKPKQKPKSKPNPAAKPKAAAKEMAKSKPAAWKREEPPRNATAAFTQAMQQHEAERQIQLDTKTREALERLDRIAYNPNAELQGVAQELGSFESKMRPVIEKVDQTIKDIERIERIKSKGTLIGMVSNIGARYIVTYADKLSEMIVEDLMADFALEMNEIEEKQKASLLNDEQQNVVLSLIENVEQLHEEQLRVQQRWLPSVHDVPHVPVHDIALDDDTGYLHPFAITAEQQVEDPAASASAPAPAEQGIVIYKPVKKGLIMALERRKKIEENARKYQAYKTRVEGSTNIDLWNAYNHITDDILAEILKDSFVDLSETLEQYIEQLIANEFQS